VALLLLYTCCVTPYILAFQKTTGSETQTVRDVVDQELIVDFFFLIDIFMNFSFAFYDSDFELIESRKVSQNLS
jgi:hypothetical protein